MFVILAGNVIDGITIYGPFDTADDANETADQYIKNQEWTVAEVHSLKHLKQL